MLSKLLFIVKSKAFNANAVAEAEIHSALIRLRKTLGWSPRNYFVAGESKVLNPDEQSDHAQFLVASGQYETLFRHMRELLDGATEVLPVEHNWLKRLAAAKIKPEALEISAILEGEA